MTSDKRIITTIAFKRGNTIELTNKLKGDQVLLPGEPAFESETGQLKIGDGSREYKDLPYVGLGLFNFGAPEAGDMLVYHPQGGGHWVKNPDTAAWEWKWEPKWLVTKMDPALFSTELPEIETPTDPETQYTHGYDSAPGFTSMKGFADADNNTVPVRRVWTDAEGEHVEIKWGGALTGNAAGVVEVELDPVEHPGVKTPFATIWQIAPELGKTVSGIAFHPETGELYNIKADGQTDPDNITYKAMKFGGGGLDVEVPATAPTTLRFFKGE